MWKAKRSYLNVLSKTFEIYRKFLVKYPVQHTYTKFQPRRKKVFYFHIFSRKFAVSRDYPKSLFGANSNNLAQIKIDFLSNHSNVQKSKYT